MPLHADIAATVKPMSLPALSQKRAIYAYHAGVVPSTDLDVFCAAFTNAYDLTVAGRCHGQASGLQSRAQLYDHYVHSCLPFHSSGIAALLRSIASDMSETLSLAWTRDEFELAAERFLTCHGISLAVLDELRKSRLVKITSDGFAFEHELLFDFFRAESLRREFPGIQDLALQLARPRNRDLIELVVSRASNGADIATILTSIDDASIFSAIIGGSCGKAAKEVARGQCAVLFSEAAADLQNISIHCELTTTEEGRRRILGVEVKGNRKWSAYAAMLCASIARKVDDTEIRYSFLELLERTETVLREAAYAAAAELSLKPHRVWGQVIRIYGLCQSGHVAVPCCAILQSLRNARRFDSEMPIRDALRNRIVKQPTNLLTLLVLMGDLLYGDTEASDIRNNLALIQLAWSSEVYVLRITALQLMRSMQSAIEAQGPDLLADAKAMLQSLETGDIFSNTDLLETLGAYDAVEPPVSFETASQEMRDLIAFHLTPDETLLDSATLCGDESHELRAKMAYGCLSNIFEDVFQGAYYEAYGSLSVDERRAMLRLAGSAKQTGMTTEWILQELLKCGDQSTVDIFERFARGVEAPALCPQEAVASFVLGIEGCARWNGHLASPTAETTLPQQAWLTIGEIIFWLEKGEDNSGHFDELWSRFTGELGLAGGDALYQLWHAGRGITKQKHDLVVRFPANVKPILERCIQSRDPLPSIFNFGSFRSGDTARFLIGQLGQIGDRSSKAVLMSIADDPDFGKEAVSAAEMIEVRLHRDRDVASGAWK